MAPSISRGVDGASRPPRSFPLVVGVPYGGRQRRAPESRLSRLRLESAAVVKATIARLILADPPSPGRVGSISLQPHQISAVARLRSALDQFNGALLCDDVGMGKTYVATAVAQQYSRCLVVAP